MPDNTYPNANGNTIVYNEGRVVGYSSYEVYVKHHLATNPDVPPASERQWLAASIAMGSSMLLKIPANTSHKESEDWMYEVSFPANSMLCAANTIIASYFRGDGHFNGVWADRITDYGDLISNTSGSSPSGTNVPTKSIDNWNQSEKQALRDYLRIVDGIVIQPGTWSNSANKPPQKDFKPDLSKNSTLRLHIKGQISQPVNILFTGFTINTVIDGVSGLDGATNTPSPQDGDFLGPGQFPWANKIIFSVPSSYISFFSINNYRRKLPVSGDQTTVDDTAVIDMKTTQPESYYVANYPEAREEINVEDYSTLGDGTAVLTVYQRSTKFPPALWGTFVDSTGQNYLNPLDVVAPGTVKMFDNPDDVKDYEDTFPGTHGIHKTEDGTLEVTDDEGNLVPAAKVDIQNIVYTNPGGSNGKAKAVVTQTGHSKGLSLSVSSGLTGSQCTIGNDTGGSNTTVGNTTFKEGSLIRISPDSSNVTIQAILEILANNKSLDILGKNLKAVKAGLPRNYIQFPNGLRLYISATEPTDTDVPEGSIGIGWGVVTE